MEEAILKTLAYGDIFSYPLTFSQLQKFLIAKRKTKKEEVKRYLEKMQKEEKIGFKKGFYFLKGKEDLVRKRRRRRLISRKKLDLAKKIAFFLKIIPFVKFLGISGRLAMENCEEEDDLDFFIIAEEGRLWLTRMLTVLLLEFFGIRRRPKEREVKDKVCLNLFLEDGFLSLPKEKRSLYTAHEVVQVKPLWDKDKTYAKFLKANEWVREYLPNAVMEDTRMLRYKDTEGRGERSLLSSLVSQFLDILESLAWKVQFWYMKKRRTREKVSLHQAFFHPKPTEDLVLKEYERRLAALKLPLDKTGRVFLK